MKQLDRARQILAEKAMKRAGDIARRYAQLFPGDEDDFRSSAAWGVIRAAASFDQEGGETWERWSSMCVRGEIRDFLQSAHMRRKGSRVDGDLDELGLEECAILDDGPSEIERIEASESFDRILDLLPPRHRDLCDLVYRDSMNPYSAGQALGMTGESGCRLHRDALRILRESLAA